MAQRLYLDTNVFNRPFDDQSQPRIWLEAQAVGVVLQAIETGEWDLVGSSILEYENSRNPYTERRAWVSRCLQLAVYRVRLDHAIIHRARVLGQQGMLAVDALHAACAECAGAVCFLTCDDQLTSTYTGSLRVLSPVDFVVGVLGVRPWQ